MDCRIPTVFPRIANQTDFDIDAADLHVPCDHPPIAPIITRAAQDQHRSLDLLFHQEIDATSSCILHQYGTRNPESLHCIAVHILHLSAR